MTTRMDGPIIFPEGTGNKLTKSYLAIFFGNIFQGKVRNSQPPQMHLIKFRKI